MTTRCPAPPILLPTLLALLLSIAPAQAADEPAVPEDATPATATTPPPPRERFSAGSASSAEQLTQALAGDTRVLTLESDSESFHALLQLPAEPEPLGAILLVADPDTAEAWAEQVAALHFALARHGWITLALQPPSPVPASVPPRTLPVRAQLTPVTAVAPTEPAPDTATPETTTPAPATPVEESAATATLPQSFAEQFNERLALVSEELDNLQNGSSSIRILLAIGRAAPWAMDYVAGHPQNALQLVMIDPQPDPAEGAPVIGELWDKLGEARVVDLYHAPLPGYPQAAPDARMRREQAQRQQLANYYQARLPGSFTGWEAQMPWLVRSVQGTLEKQILEPIRAAAELKAAAAANPPPSQRPPGGGKGSSNFTLD